MNAFQVLCGGSLLLFAGALVVLFLWMKYTIY